MPPTVLVYGDSLTVQSEAAARYLNGNVDENLVFRDGMGTAICDWMPQATQDSLSLHPQRIVLAFTGNTGPPCVAGAFRATGTTGAIAVYEYSLRQIRALFPAAQFTIVIPPAVSNPDNPLRLNGSPALIAMYEQVGAELHMAINPDADNALTPHHVYALERPRFPSGPLVVVRNADGLHLTPAGALWYGAALLEVRQFVPVPSPTPSLPTATSG